jgi:hypothetical protein
MERRENNLTDGELLADVLDLLMSSAVHFRCDELGSTALSRIFPPCCKNRLNPPVTL